MSLPLTRRIARAALLVAAGAAAGVGAAGTAGAATNQPAVPDLGGLSKLDGATHVDKTVGGLANSKALKKAVPAPAAGKAAGNVLGGLPLKGLPLG
ncbi:ATP-binding protein [Streptomyces sp. NBC_01171]|uniref:ATP-binding protein n=1 Tax=Streptomyces sp. NBC_01171 TaxID=2903757 RepID=UPI0038645F10